MPSLSQPKIIRVDRPARFHLSAIRPADTNGLHIEKDEAEAVLKDHARKLAKLQERLYAERRWAVVVVLQGMDTAGKDGITEHVFQGINPQGCHVHSFKQPSTEELAHDFLWRVSGNLPERGHIGVFNRSHYEDVIVVRVHPELLEHQGMPRALAGKSVWRRRFESINAFERHLADNGTVVLKFFLHISKGEQLDRLLARLEDPEKHWKFSAGDFAERKLWPRYMAAYQDMIRNTSTEYAPWHVVPADDKWHGRLVVARALLDALERIDPKFPKADAATLREMDEVRRDLQAGRGKSR